MTKENLKNSIILDLGSNYKNTDSTLLGNILDEVIDDALKISNRNFKVDATDVSTLEAQLDVLRSEIRRATKSIYLLRGAEDVTSQSQSGLNSSYDDVQLRMRDDIIKGGKRIMA